MMMMMSRSSYIPFDGKELHMLFPIETYDYVPILSVLIDEYMQLYLCLCSEIRGKMRWIVSLTTLDVIQKLVDLEFSVNQALKGVQDKVFIIEYCEGQYSYDTCSFATINPLYLAEDDTYAEFQDEDVDVNLKIWKQVLNVSSKYYTSRIDTNSSVNQECKKDEQQHGNDSICHSQTHCSMKSAYYSNYYTQPRTNGYAENVRTPAA